MPKYRLCDDVPWDQLNGRQVRLEVSPGYIIAVRRDPLTKDEQLVKLAVAMRAGHRPKPALNGQPELTAEPQAETPVAATPVTTPPEETPR